MRLKYSLLEWQNKALEAWERSGRHGIVSVVTGGGKTIFAHACMIRHLSDNPKGHVIIIVPTIALADQWYVSLIVDANVKENEIATISGKNKGDFKRINIAVINTARVISEKFSLLKNSMIIVDECHRAGSKENRKAISWKFSSSVGLSATPEREYDNALVENIIPQIGNIIYEFDLHDALVDNLVSPFSLVNVRVELLYYEEKKYRSFSKRIAISINKSRYPGDKYSTIANNLMLARARLVSIASMRIPTAVKIIENHRGAKSILFHQSIDSINTILYNMTVNNHSVIPYHTRISPVMRRSNLLLFRKGVYDCLLSCRALDEGLNVPEIEIAVIASSNATKRQRVQRLGRALRSTRNKNKAIIYTIYATDAEERKLHEEAQEYVEHVSTQWLRAEGL